LRTPYYEQRAIINSSLKAGEDKDMDEEPKQESQAPQKSKKGYGKRPMWQWVVIYLIVAIIVYGLVYLLFIHKGGSSGTSTSGY